MTPGALHRVSVIAFVFFLVGGLGSLLLLLPGRAAEEDTYESATKVAGDVVFRGVKCTRGHTLRCSYTFSAGSVDRVLGLDPKLQDHWAVGDHVHAMLYAGDRIGAVEIDGTMTRPRGNPAQAMGMLLVVGLAELAIAFGLGVHLWRTRRRRE